MNNCGDSSRVEQGIFQFQDGGSIPTSPLHIKAKYLTISQCGVSEIRDFIEANHYSKNINGVKISYCFKVEYQSTLVGGVLFEAIS